MKLVTPNDMNKRLSENFAETLINNPQELIDWAKREIDEYENFIKILKKQIEYNKLKK